jgi:hypothetical protein
VPPGSVFTASRSTPVTGEYTVLVGDPAPPAKAPAEDADLDRELTDWEKQHRGR